MAGLPGMDVGMTILIEYKLIEYNVDMQKSLYFYIWAINIWKQNLNIIPLTITPKS